MKTEKLSWAYELGSLRAYLGLRWAAGEAMSTQQSVSQNLVNLEYQVDECSLHGGVGGGLEHEDSLRALTGQPETSIL